MIQWNQLLFGRTLRIFSAVHKYASRHVPSNRDQGTLGVCATYELSTQLIGIPIENVVRDYGEEPAEISITLDNGCTVHIKLHPDHQVVAFLETEGKIPRSVADYRRLVPVNLVIVPTLSALEESERLVQEDTVAQNENTRLASRNFRNILLRKSDAEFAEFSELVATGWGGIEIERPEVVRSQLPFVNMMYRENRIPRELFWAGFGFQVWMQMMLQFLRGSASSILVLDEPDIYLHPDLQKKLLRMGKERFGQIFIATHSTEILNEADSGDILSINPNNSTAQRVTTDDGSRRLYSYIGSSENSEFARLARAERIVFFEGKERGLIKKFASKIRAAAIFQDPKTVYLQAGGFSQWVRVREVDWALHNNFGLDVKIAALFDRDFRCDEEIDKFKTDLANDGLWIDVLERKEIENYALIIRPLVAAIQKRLRGREIEIAAIEIERIILELSEPFRGDCQAHQLAHYLSYHQGANKDLDASTHLAKASEIFEAAWRDMKTRLSIIPGKNYISVLSARLQKDYGVSITINQILDEFEAADIPIDLADRLEAMATFLGE